MKILKQFIYNSTEKDDILRKNITEYVQELYTGNDKIPLK